MNRELKFRAWHKIEKRFVDLRDINFESDTVGYDCEGEANYYDVAKFSDVVIQQFTGILDEDGKEIYEGDLVEIIYGENLIAEVHYQANMSCIRLKCNDGQSYPFVAYRFDENNKPIGVVNVAKKVIGNIFENIWRLK